MENLEIVGVIRAPSSQNRRYENRHSHALVLKLGSPSRYYFQNETVDLRCNQVLFLPKGSCYTVTRLGELQSEYCLINFQADIPNAAPLVATLPPQLEAAELCRQLTQLRLLQTPADRCRLAALFYTLAACLCDGAQLPLEQELQLHRLAPALEQLRQQLFSPQLRIEQLHRLCGVSDTYFRSLFCRCFGMNPKRYVLQQRLSHAKALLDAGECDSIAQAARVSGFEDPLYFSKVFKKRFGYPPSGPSQEP